MSRPLVSGSVSCGCGACEEWRELRAVYDEGGRREEVEIAGNRLLKLNRRAATCPGWWWFHHYVLGPTVRKDT